MRDFETGNLIYLIVLGCALLFWFISQNRASFGKLTQQALTWGLIFAGVLAVVGMWDHIRDTVAPRQSVQADAGVIALPRQQDGHYYLSAQVNGTTLRFVVDTGATDIVLSREDARAAGFADQDLHFFGSAMTANGMIKTAPVTLETFQVGEIKDRNLRAVVNGGDLDTSLLGMGYLQRFSSVEITKGRLILTR